jgi:protein SCO1
MKRRTFLTRSSAIVGGAAATGAAVAGLGLARPASAAARRFPDVEVWSHDGRRFRFYEDLVRGRIATFNFMFTGCGDTCPLVTQNLGRMQDLLGERVGRDVVMYSLTLQPELDTPEVLRDYAASYGVKPGWRFLTGAKEDMERLRRALGFANQDPELDIIKDEHTGLVRFCNEELERWGACPALSRPEFLAKVIRTQMTPGGDRRPEDRVGAI